MYSHQAIATLTLVGAAQNRLGNVTQATVLRCERIGAKDRGRCVHSTIFLVAEPQHDSVRSSLLYGETSPAVV